MWMVTCGFDDSVTVRYFSDYYLSIDCSETMINGVFVCCEFDKMIETLSAVLNDINHRIDINIAELPF